MSHILRFLVLIAGLKPVLLHITIPAVPRLKKSTAAEMRQFVADCHQRFGFPPSANLEDTTLQVAFAGWSAVVWVEENADVMQGEMVSTRSGKPKVKAGNSAAKQLWQDRVMLVPVLSAYYRIPARVPKWVLPAGVATGHFPAVAAPSAAPHAASQAASPYVITLANKPSVLIDRATRSPAGWNDVTLQYRDTFDEGDGLVLNYFEENAAPDALRAQLQTLDPRTSDVWRLLTAKALECEVDDTFAPIEIKPAELARALGLKPHPKGGMRGKDLVRCTQSLFHLERLWLTLPGEQKGRQKRVLAVMERGELRQVEGKEIPSSWTLVLGEWVKFFPRSFAPIFRGLVELPANSATNVWTKQIGTELTYWFRETAGDPTLTRLIEVRMLLQRASLEQEVNELREQKNLNRAIERFENALNLLKQIGLHDQWEYEPGSSALMDDMHGRPGFAEIWLGAVVQLTVPAHFLESIAELSPPT